MAAMDDCGWCGEAQWNFRCSSCDPRSEKKLCSSCSDLWHARGFARSHQLTSRLGLKCCWEAPREPASIGNTTSYSNAGTQNQATAAVHFIEVGNGAGAPTVPATDAQAAERGEQPKECEKLAAKDDAEAPKETPSEEEKVAIVPVQEEEKEDDSMEEEFGFVGESVHSGEDGDAASVENDGDVGAKGTAGEEAANSAAGAVLPRTEGSTPKEQHLESNGAQEDAERASVSASTAPNHPAVSRPLAVPVSAQDSPSTSSPHPAATSAAASSTARASTSAAAAELRTERSATSKKQTSQTKPIDLEKLLRWFPTTDALLMGMLATRLEAALIVEDALICARIGKCEDQTCRSTLLHYEHCKRDEMCGDPKCSEIAIVYRHRRACLKKETTPTTDGKQFVCPFCIRIRQRRSLGMAAALDHLISDQRRVLQSANSEANRNFCLQSINTWAQRRQVLRAETDRLNQLASESSAPIFNFPRYQWHFGDAVLIKREPTPLEVSENTALEPSAAESWRENSNEVTEAEKSVPSGKEEENACTPADETNNRESQDTEDSMPGHVNFNADFINELLIAKAEDGDSKEMAQREFNGVMELGYAIVDASFCAPSKAQRCLLNCTSILVHLQHHLDLEVCNQPMCTAVEHHFAHLSQCKARQESKSCEYCLRVEERQLVRSVDFMEAQQPEAEAKVQKIINDITASFTNHRSEEREQEVIQLEDELEQAEENKRELSDKLGAARHNLRKVRKNLEHRDISTSGSQRLPVHFVKFRRGDGSSGSSSKKRRLLGSLD